MRDHRWFAVPEAARVLNMSERTLRRWVKERRIESRDRRRAKGVEIDVIEAALVLEEQRARPSGRLPKSA